MLYRFKERHRNGVYLIPVILANTSIFTYFKTLPEKNQKELIKIAEAELKKLNITPETPGYNTNL